MATATESEQSIVDEVHKGLYIGGEWRESAEGDSFEVEDPSTGEALCEVADASADDARAAMDAAAGAQDSWRWHAPRERGEILRRAFDEITERVDELALLMTLEMGKPIHDSKAEISYAAEFFRWYSEQAVRLDGRYSVNANGAGRMLTMKQPVGPCYMITPWNFPLAMGTRKIGPAIAAGCTMIMKPAKLTPLSMLALVDILERAGLPEGVLNVVPTSSSSAVSEPILGDARLRKLTFTGSTPVGKTLMQQAADQVLRVSMELGGNAPFLGFHVADGVADEFGEKLAEKMGGMKVARGTEDGAQVGPLIDEDQRSTVRGLVDDAVDRGAKALVGGKDVDGAGYFYEPTVLAEVSNEAELRYEEIFGPVAPVFSFSSEEDAIREANDTEYGLVAYVYTRDVKRALRVCEELECGMVGLNQGMVSNAAAPFGGVKQSGFGREGGYEGIEEYLETKYVAVNLPAEAPKFTGGTSVQ